MTTHLILGGARSGKSRLAETLALQSGLEVVVIATGQALDDEMAERIARHQADRPAAFLTVEEPLALADALCAHVRSSRCLVVDCLTLWVSNLLMAELEGDEGGLEREVVKLLAALASVSSPVLLVANEVGLGLVPETPLGRRFRDEAGRLNQRVAACCEAVTFVAAGLPMKLKG